MIARWLLVTGLILLAACDDTAKSDDPMEVHPLPEFSTDIPYNRFGETIMERSEVFVISNATDDSDKLIAFSKEYNHQHPLDADDLKKYFSYVRMFYRESKAMPRDYKERHEGYFDIDRLADHGEDGFSRSMARLRS